MTTPTLPPPDRCLALIPARGGSKRIPRKNVREFHGKPMIAWSIEAARSAGVFGEVVVSTDDEEIAETGRNWGAETPFRRPASHADDNTGIREVIVQGIEEMGKLGRMPEFVCCVIATAPAVRPGDIRRGLEQLMESGAHFAFSVTRFPSPVQRAMRIREDGRLEMMHPEFRLARSQDMEEAYHDAAQFYWGRSASFLDRSQWIPAPSSVPVVLPMERVLDIDTPEDWARAEKLFPLMRAEANGLREREGRD
jgi:pseudaminic acid cytidylyltransferase